MAGRDRLLAVDRRRIAVRPRHVDDHSGDGLVCLDEGEDPVHLDLGAVPDQNFPPTPI